MPYSDSVAVLLAGRAGVYRLLQNLLGNEPSQETVRQLSSEDNHEVLSLFRSGGGEYQKALSTFESVSQEIVADKTEAIECLVIGFTRLFVGPGMVEAAPWESYYVSKDNSLFQEATLEVRKEYVCQGLLPQGYPSVADDHLALELDYLARLAERMLDAYDTADYGAVLGFLEASEAFLRRHLLVWAPRFAEALAKAAHAYFYSATADLLVAFLAVDLQALCEVMEQLGKQGL